MACDQCALRRNLAEGEFSQCGTGEVKPKDVVGRYTLVATAIYSTFW